MKNILVIPFYKSVMYQFFITVISLLCTYVLSLKYNFILMPHIIEIILYKFDFNY